MNSRLQNWLLELNQSDGTGMAERSKNDASRKTKEAELPDHVYETIALVFRFLQLLCENHNLDLQVSISLQFN